MFCICLSYYDRNFQGVVSSCLVLKRDVLMIRANHFRISLLRSDC